MKKNIIIPLIVISLVIVAVIAVMAFSKVTDITSSDGFLKVQLFDKDGNPLSAVNTYATVNEKAGVASMLITATVINSGTLPLSCQISSSTVNGATNGGFTFPSDTKLLSRGGQIAFTSNLIQPDVSPLGIYGANVWFNVTVTCNANGVNGVIPLTPKTGGISLSILSDGTGDFIVNLGNPEGIPTKYCGDNACSPEIGETTTNCAVDCGTKYNVSMRTTDSSYAFGSSLGYSAGGCGFSLQKYSTNSLTYYSAPALTGSCPTPGAVGALTQVLIGKTLPETTTWSTTNPCMYTTSSGGVIIAIRVDSLTGVPMQGTSIGNNWIAVNYISNANANVSTDYRGFNLQKEVSC